MHMFYYFQEIKEWRKKNQDTKHIWLELNHWGINKNI